MRLLRDQEWVGSNWRGEEEVRTIKSITGPNEYDIVTYIDQFGDEYNCTVGQFRGFIASTDAEVQDGPTDVEPPETVVEVLEAVVEVKQTISAMVVPPAEDLGSQEMRHEGEVAVSIELKDGQTWRPTAGPGRKVNRTVLAASQYDVKYRTDGLEYTVSREEFEDWIRRRGAVVVPEKPEFESIISKKESYGVAESKPREDGMVDVVFPGGAQALVPESKLVKPDTLPEVIEHQDEAFDEVKARLNNIVSISEGWANERLDRIAKIAREAIAILEKGRERS